MSSPPIAIEKPTLLIVEGKEDKLFFEGLSNHMRISGLQILPIGGKTQLETNLKTLALTSGFSSVKSIGIVRDGDENPQGAFQKVCSALTAANLTVPQRTCEALGENPQVTIMITPDGSSPGMLEDICLSAVADSASTPCVDAYFGCLREAGITLRSNVLSKARIHTFLASCEEPDLRLGEAAQKGYFHWEHDAFRLARDFLRQISTY